MSDWPGSGADPTGRRRTAQGVGRAAMGLATALLGVAGGSGPAEAQEACPMGAVSRVEVVNHSIFEEEVTENGRLAWARSVVNALHVRTREGLIRDELTLEPGGCFEPQALEDSERLLRELHFIARAEVRAERASDGRWVITAETWDEWTTTVGLNIAVEDELRFQGGFVKERNLLGTGTTLFLEHDRARQKRDLTVRLAASRLAGTRANGRIEGGTTRNGHLFEALLEYPFVGERGRVQAGGRALFEDRNVRYATGDGDGLSHLLLPLEDRGGRAWLDRRFGEPGALRTLGVELDVLDRSMGGPLQVAYGNSFGELEPLPDSLAGILGSQATPPSRVRVGISGALRHLDFQRWRGVDLVTGLQDVALGAEARLTVGRTLTSLDSGPRSSWGRLEAFASQAAGHRLLAQASLDAQARLLDADPPGGRRIRDAELDARARVFVRPSPEARHNLQLSARLRGGWRMQAPFQLALGGANGVRSHVDYELPAARTMVVHLEEQWNPGLFEPNADVGLTFFADLGRGWAGGVPFGHDTGWQHGVGAGLRLGFPAGTGTVLRVEMAWPTSEGARGSVFRAYWSRVETSR